MSQFTLEPAVQRMVRLIATVPDDLLGQPTPCERYTVGDLLDHISANVLVFIAAATKQPSEGGPSGDAANLGNDWRTRLPRDLATLASAWGDPAAWTGTTRAAGVDLPAAMAGVVVLDELVIHGWDLARALRQPAGYDGPELQAVYDMVQQFRASGATGLYGPPVPIPDDAPLIDRVLGLSGRDPGWEPGR